MSQILAIAGGVISALGTFQQGRLAEARGEAEDKIAQFNARQLDKQAKARVKASLLREERVSRAEKAFRGQQRTKFSKSLIAISDGSPIDVLADTAFQFHIERNLTLRQGLVESEQLKTQANLQRAGGKLAKAFGKAQKRVSVLSAFGQALGSSGSQQPSSTLGSNSALNTRSSNTTIPSRASFGIN